MEPFYELLLNVWREACRHIEITESATTIASSKWIGSRFGGPAWHEYR
jgi:hypothetical protein